MTQISSALAHARGGNLRPYCFLTLAFLMMALNVGFAALGPARMGIFNCLPPLFVAAIAIPVLGEALHWYHQVGFAIVAVGIVTSVRGRDNVELPIGKS